MPVGVARFCFSNFPEPNLKLIKGKRDVMAETAIDLSEELKASPELWMNLQTQLDLAAALKKRSA